jgi:hypothetical protein
MQGDGGREIHRPDLGLPGTRTPNLKPHEREATAQSSRHAALRSSVAMLRTIGGRRARAVQAMLSRCDSYQRTYGPTVREDSEPSALATVTINVEAAGGIPGLKVHSQSISVPLPPERPDAG